MNGRTLAAAAAPCPPWCRYATAGHPAGLSSRRGCVSDEKVVLLGGETTPAVTMQIQRRPRWPRAQVVMTFADGAVGRLDLPEAKYTGLLLDILVADHWTTVDSSVSA